MSAKEIVSCWVFASSSGSGTYQTLKYGDATTSCNCPGWTRRTGPGGVRSCKHTRYVDCGVADTFAGSFNHYRRQPEPEMAGPAGRAFNFED